MQTKQCSQCFQWKDVSEFYPMGNGRQEFRSECKACNAAWQKRRRIGRGVALADHYQQYYQDMRAQGYRRVGNRWVYEGE